MNDFRFADAGLAIGTCIAEYHHELVLAARAAGQSPNHAAVADAIRARCQDHTDRLRDIVAALQPDMTDEQWEWVRASARRGQRLRTHQLTHSKE